MTLASKGHVEWRFACLVLHRFQWSSKPTVIKNILAKLVENTHHAAQLLTVGRGGKTNYTSNALRHYPKTIGAELVTEKFDFGAVEFALGCTSPNVEFREALSKFDKVLVVLVKSRGENDDVVNIAASTYPKHRAKYTVHEALERGRHVAKTKWATSKLVRAMPHTPKRCERL